MKKTFAGFVILTTSLTLFLGFFGVWMMQTTFQREILKVSNLAGAVLTEYPDTKQTILLAIQDDSFCTVEEGFSFLSQYGYDNEQRFSENLFYQYHSHIYLAGLFLFLLLTLSAEGCFLWSHFQKEKRQEEALFTIADHYFSEDYQILENIELQKQLNNPFLTELFRRLGENLQQKSQSLAEERDYTKTLVTDISHQLKTPISALKTCFSMYLEADAPEEKEEFLKRSQHQMDKLEALISSLIQISRLETSLITLQKESVTLTDLLVGAVNSIYHKAAQKKISIETFPDTFVFDDIMLELDRKWTTEALVNILDNAVKYSPFESLIQIRVQKLFSFVRVEFEDEGIGIPSNERNQIFRRFYRGTVDEVKNAEGSGVGLYLTRKILEEQGATVTVHSAIPKGSVFVVQLPL